ncbi:CG0192-related protein [Propionicimonas sp.]|uniref:CG0192-related protein n=1 Tax=Propionicimonas sp. TaxID=1955623 RepID=UPI0039E49419
MSGTAEIHEATLTPGKLELLAAWLPAQEWFLGDSDDVERVASYRFVDPEGEVGIETILVRSRGVTYQVPLTYRGAPLDEAKDYLVGTLEHSVLGTRHVYDAVGDPVYMVELLRVIHEGDTEADLSRGQKSMTVRGSGIVPVSNAASEAMRVVRVLDGNHVPGSRVPLGTLEGRWTAADGSVQEETLAVLR